MRKLVSPLFLFCKKPSLFWNYNEVISVESNLKALKCYNGYSNSIAITNWLKPRRVKPGRKLSPINTLCSKPQVDQVWLTGRFLKSPTTPKPLSPVICEWNYYHIPGIPHEQNKGTFEPSISSITTIP